MSFLYRDFGIFYSLLGGLLYTSYVCYLSRTDYTDPTNYAYYTYCTDSTNCTGHSIVEEMGENGEDEAYASLLTKSNTTENLQEATSLIAVPLQNMAT